MQTHPTWLGSRSLAQVAQALSRRFLIAIVLTLTLPILGAAQGVGLFCPDSAFGGTCDIANPVYVNVYWDTDKQTWDQDEIKASQGDMLSGRIDALMQAITHSNYFAGLGGYSVVSATFLRSIASDCVPVPTTIDQAHDLMDAFMTCILAANPDLDPTHTIFNVLLPPQTVPASPTAAFCSGASADHDQYLASGSWPGGVDVVVTRIPTNSSCNSNIGALFVSLTHEMVEAATDPNVASPTGWKVAGGGNCDEIADLCSSSPCPTAPTPPFLYASISEYWVNGPNNCFAPSSYIVPSGAKPSITVSGIRGSGKSAIFSLTGPSLGAASKFLGTPWDLISGGGRTLYLRAAITHGGQTWGVGNIQGAPPDIVGFESIKWTDDAKTVNITVNGFDDNYATTQPNGSFALIAPGDSVTFTYFDPNSGLSTTATGIAPFPAKITASLDETRPQHPTVQDSEFFSGAVLDSQGQGMEGVTVSCVGCPGSPSAKTASSGAFIMGMPPGPVAGSQDVTFQTPGAQNTQVNLTLANSVYPVVSSIQPAIGPIAGNIPAKLSGAGFDPAQLRTIINFAPAGFVPPPFRGGKNINPQSVAPDFKSAQLQIPASPLPGDGSGLANVSAVVNNLQSTAIEFLYVVPGKPVLDFRAFLCGGGQVTPNVYGSDGSPVQVLVALTAAYNAFQQSNGPFTSSITVMSGQVVSYAGEGPFTATNTQTSQSVTSSVTLPQVIPCTAGTLLLPKLEGVVFSNPGLWINHIGPGCGDCPTDLSHNVVWTASQDVTNAAAFVSIAGRSASQVRGTFEVRNVGADEFKSYVTENTLAAVQGVSFESKEHSDTSLGHLQFVGPAMAIGLRRHKSKHTNEVFTVSFRLAKNALPSPDYRIMHLVQVNGKPSWQEEVPTKISGHGRSVTIASKELGVYALAQLPGTNVSSNRVTDEKKKP